MPAVSDYIDDITTPEHLVGALRCWSERIAPRCLARPRQAVPVDCLEAERLDEDARRLVGDGDHHCRRQHPHPGVFLQDLLELIGLRRATKRRMTGWPAPAIAPVVLDEADAYGAVGGRLQPRVERGVDLVASRFGLRSVATPDLEPHHLGHVLRVDVIEWLMGARHDRLCVGRSGDGRIDVAELAHAPQHVGTAHLCKLRVDDRVVARGRLRNARERRRLRDAQLIEGLAEEGLRGRGDSIGALPEEDHIQIQPEDLLLRELVLHPISEEGFLELAPPRLVERQEHVARGLHGDGARALRAIARDQIDQHRAHHTGIVDAVVLEEPIVLGREKRLFDDLRDLLVAHRDAPLLTDLRDQIAVARVHAQRHLESDVAHRCDRRQRWLEVDITAGERVRRQNCEQRHAACTEYEYLKVLTFHRT